MVPYTPLHMLIFEDGPDALVMTSANRTDEPICIDNDEAVDRLAGIADAFLVHDRPINLRADDSVAAATPGRPTLIRRARGYVPGGVDTGVDVDGIAGFGAMLKNTPALGRGSVLYPGQHIGDLNNSPATGMFHEVYDHLREILGVEVSAVACDLHPDYPSTELAERTGLPVTRVQHHHAHLVGLMGEVRHYDRSIGIALDGAGLGDDGAIWGGEVFSFTPSDYERRLHLEYVPLPGGDAAARQPWRMALAYLLHHGLDWERYVQEPGAQNVAALIDSPLCKWRTSSMGRLFDAVSSLCDLCHEQSFEAKAPMLLEGAMVETGDWYEFSLRGDEICTCEIIEGILDDIDAGEPAGVIAGRFHETVVHIILACAERLRADEGLDTVFLSGGCMVNGYLASRAPVVLEDAGFKVHRHSLLPPNDGAISAGQVLVAAARQTPQV
jgi:hydrogenase maturation protein HypF